MNYTRKLWWKMRLAELGIVVILIIWAAVSLGYLAYAGEPTPEEVATAYQTPPNLPTQPYQQGDPVWFKNAQGRNLKAKITQVAPWWDQDSNSWKISVNMEVVQEIVGIPIDSDRISKREPEPPGPEKK